MLGRHGGRNGILVAIGLVSLAGSQLLTEGVNHFWIAVEPRRSARWGHRLDAEVVSFSLLGTGGGTKMPAVTAPAPAVPDVALARVAP